MGTELMTGKERWIATLKMQEVDRLIYWPKLALSYPGYRKGSGAGMSLLELLYLVGSDIHGGCVSCLTTVYKNGSGFEFDMPDENTQVFYYITGSGRCKGINKRDPATLSWHPAEFPIKTVEDIKIMTQWYTDITNDVDTQLLKKSVEQYNSYGDTAIVTTSAASKEIRCESPIMTFLEWHAGIVNGQYLIADYTEEVETLFDVMHEDLKSKVRIVSENSPADAVYMVENTSTTLISLSQYAKYCFDYINEYAEIIKSNNKFCGLHMCGHLKNLLPQLNLTKADFFEALTPPSVGNTDLVTARAMCPNKAFLGGTGANMWIGSEKDLIDYIDSQVNALPHLRGIGITSAGEMPPMCEPEFIKKIGEYVKSIKYR